jgi:hypothetical protein
MFATANPRTQAGRLSIGGFDVRCLMFEGTRKEENKAGSKAADAGAFIGHELVF